MLKHVKSRQQTLCLVNFANHSTTFCFYQGQPSTQISNLSCKFNYALLGDVSSLKIHRPKSEPGPGTRTNRESETYRESETKNQKLKAANQKLKSANQKPKSRESETKNPANQKLKCANQKQNSANQKLRIRN